jgi:hypothetical protein
MIGELLFRSHLAQDLSATALHGDEVTNGQKQ